MTPAELRGAFLAHLGGDYAIAETVYRRAIAGAQFQLVPYRHLVRLLAEQHRWEDAIEVFRDALKLYPNKEMEYELSTVLLSLGRYAEGWPLYEARAAGRPGLARPTGLPFPEWDGGEVRSLVVFREQGFGDTIQFARFLPQLKARGIAVTLMVQPELERLFDGLGVSLLPVRGAVDLPKADAWTMICSLGHRLGITVDDLPGATNYLTADPALKAAWKARLPAGVRIGVAATGNRAHQNDAERSLPPEARAILLSQQGAISLVPEDVNLPIKDFADTAAIIDQLDLVITVDTAAAHLAGAMGKPCWLLLPHRGTDWRWLRERKDSPWYPSVKIYRQPKAGDWASVLRDVALDLPRALAAR